MIVGGAIMGRMVLNESVTMRMAFSTIVLIGAISILSLGAGEASRQVVVAQSPPSIGLVSAGVGAACLSGVAYALLGVSIRYAVTDRMSIPLTLVSVTLTGVIALGAVTIAHIGVAGMLATLPRHFWTMMLAGVLQRRGLPGVGQVAAAYPRGLRERTECLAGGDGGVAGILMFAETIISGPLARCGPDRRRTAHDAAEVARQST